MAKHTMSLVLRVVVSIFLACLLLSAPCCNAINVNLRSDSFARARNLRTHKIPKSTEGPHKSVMYHEYKDFLMTGGLRRGLIARMDYAGDYNTAGVANTNTGSTTPSTPAP